MAGEKHLMQPAYKEAPAAADPAPLTLTWNDLTIGQWKNLLARTPRSNALLAWPVALATYQTRRQKPHFGVLYQQGEPVALVLVHQWKFAFFEKVYIHRSPLWLTAPTDSMVLEALRLLRDAWPAKPFRQVHFMPEMPNTPQSHAHLEKAGFTSRHTPPYRSLWLDITSPMPALEQNLKKGWRNALKKSRKQQLTFTTDYTKPGYRLFLRGYRRDKSLKGYQGPSVLFLLNLRKHAKKEDILMLEAWHHGQLVAGQYFVCHGQAATYLVGWTTPEGRNVAAHNGLLFDGAIAKLKEKGITTLDLGGLAENNQGLNRFKEGMGADMYELAGQWKL